MNILEITPNKFPKHLLPHCDSGLCLFGAGFYGANDAIHMYIEDIKRVDIVDIDEQKMKEMSKTYTTGWGFTVMDVVQWIDEWAVGATWDIVSVDPPVAMQEWCIFNLKAICNLANKYVVLSTNDQWAEWLTEEYSVKEVLRRSANTYLIVLEV
jgi:hypothetical protein